MQLQQRINAFAELGKFLSQFASRPFSAHPSVAHNELFFNKMQTAIANAKAANAWFTEDNLEFTFANWSQALSLENIQQWVGSYSISTTSNDPKTVAVIMAGNIPLVGFHDFLSVLISGNAVLGKLSSNDSVLLPLLANYLMTVAPEFKDKISLTSGQLKAFDAVIATGSDNTALYFEHYFGKYPNIIRKNRNSVAILTGNESPRQMEALADDIFRYFGLGCRNVSKIYVPKNYDWDHFFNGMFAWKSVINNHKYINNYDYNKAVYLMSDMKLLDNEFMLLKEDKSFASPISVVFYEEYSTVDVLQSRLKAEGQHIQCIVSNQEAHIDFGAAQSPKLWDYADGVDTLEFILKLNQT